jgi:hypothetical protein
MSYVQRLDKIDVYKMYIKVADVTVPLYFCRENDNVDAKLQSRNICIIHEILMAHNFTSYMHLTDLYHDEVIDYRSIEKDVSLKSKITGNLGHLREDVNT